MPEGIPGTGMPFLFLTFGKEYLGFMELKTFFEQNPSGALAFSGGTDSSLLVWAAAKYAF